MRNNFIKRMSWSDLVGRVIPNCITLQPFPVQETMEISGSMIFLVLMWAFVPKSWAQAPTRADIIDLQNQINALNNRLAYDESLIETNNVLIQQLSLLEAVHYNESVDNFNYVYGRLNTLDNAVATLNANVNALSATLLAVVATVEEMEIEMARLLKNNEIWLNNFRVIKNIFQNGLKFRGQINYGQAVSVGSIVPRTRPRPVLKTVALNTAGPRPARRPAAAARPVAAGNRPVTAIRTVRPARGVAAGRGTVRPVNGK